MKNNQVMTLKEWIITIVLLFIPIVSLVMLIVWAVDRDDKRNTFAKAYLIVSGGFFALVFIFYILMIAFFFFVSIFFAATG